MRIRKVVIFLVFLSFLLSVGCVFASDINETLSQEDNLIDMSSEVVVLSDNVYDESQENLTINNLIIENNAYNVTISLNDTSVKSLSTKEDNQTQNITKNYLKVDYNSSDFILKGNYSIVCDRPVIVNDDFEDGGKPTGWDYQDVSIYSYQRYAKNGKRFLTLSPEGYISQYINLDTVDFISFWYMSENKESRINVLFDDELFFEYSIHNIGIGKWEEVILDVSNITGFHFLKFQQKNTAGYLDYINIIHNSNLWVNFTLTSFSLVGDNLTLSFNDYSYGLISGWLWDFGDGNTSTQQNVTHSFKNGHYTIILKAYNENTTKYAYYNIPITFPTIERTGVEYNSVQSAIDDAVENDVINVYNNMFYNTYTEDLIIDKSLTLNFYNCSLINSSIDVVNGSNVTINEIYLNNVSLNIFNSSNLILTQLGIENMILSDCNIQFTDTVFNNTFFNFYNSNVTFKNCNIRNGGVFTWNCSLIVNDCVFTNCSEAIQQHNTKSNITGNIFHDNNISINIINSHSDLSFNTFYYNNISLLFNNSEVCYDDNWWGTNNPVYVYGLLNNSDICQLSGAKSQLNSWLILNITQSSYLDYKYYIAGITYYNLTFDITHNNLGKNICANNLLNNLRVNVSYIDEYIYYERHSYYGNVEKIFQNVVSQELDIINGKSECLFSLGYLTSNLSSLNLNILGEIYTLSLLSNSVNPLISYFTPSTTFDDTLIVKFDCIGENAVIFYTLDGSNPGYSSTRLVYSEPFVVNDSCTVHYTVIDKWGNFQKVYLDNIRKDESASFTKQDVYVELIGGGNKYYSLDGTKFTSIMWGDNAFENYTFYYHPFIVFGSVEINFCGEYYYSDYAKYYLANGQVYMYSYGFDFSVNYLKNISFSNSDAIWSQYQGNINNTGATNYDGPMSNHSSWVNYDIFSSSSAVIDSKGHIIVGGSDGYLYYLNSFGQVIWRFGTTSRIICTPTIGADGNIYFSNWMNSSVYCISPEGQLVWKYNLGDYNTGTSPVFGLDNRLYIVTSNYLHSNMYIFKDGVLLSNNTIPFISSSTPVVSNEGLLYLISGCHELVILNFDGSLKQSIFIDSDSFIKSNNQNTKLSVSMDSDGVFYILNYIRSYKLVPDHWTYLEDYGWVVDHDVTYYYAINAYYYNGTCKWSIPYFNEQMSGTPTIYKNVLYIAGNNKLIAVNSTNGNILWTKSIANTGSTASSPLVSENEILYVTSNNMVYAFNLTGDLIWQYELTSNYGSPISYSSPTLSNDGTLIVTTNLGIYAFRDIAADFTYYHINGTESTIQFIDQSTQGNNRYYWMFGDNTTSREQNPNHTYAQGGKYKVLLLVEYNGTVNLARNMTVWVEYYDITPPSNVTAYINNNITNGGTFNTTQTVSLNATDNHSNVTIYYTVDGSNPLNSQTRRVYSSPFEIEVTTVLSMVAIDSAGNIGNISSIVLNITDAVNIHDLINSTLINEIQTLLDTIDAGSKVVFDWGVLYGANFTINKPLNIISNNNTNLIGNGVQPVFIITKNATGTIINGFNIQNDNAEGILVNNTNNVLIRDTFVSAPNSVGIDILNSKNITILNTNVNGSDEGILINQSLNTLIQGVHVHDCYSDGVWVLKSKDTTITNSLIENNGLDPYKLESGINQLKPNWRGMPEFVINLPANQSRANNILIDDSINTNIVNNIINYGYFGIRLYHTTDGTVIDNNIINETVGDAILLTNKYYNVNITHNLIEGCYNGVDFMGYSEDVLIKQNTIKLLHEHTGDLFSFANEILLRQIAGYVYETYFPPDQFYNHCYNGIQVGYPASNFDEGDTVIIDNVIIRVQHRSWEARKYGGYLNTGCEGYGYNLMDGSYSYSLTNFGGATSYHEGKVDLVVDRIGDATFRLRLINRLDNHYLSEIPEFDVIFESGGFTQTVKFINDSAIATFDVAAAVSDIVAIISGEIRKSAHFDMPITEGYNSTNRATDPGFEEGEAYHNPDPVIPPVPPEGYDYDSNFNLIPVNPVIEPVVPDTGEGSGNGSGNGNGTGDGRFDGNGNGSAFGDDTGTHGSADTNIHGREGQTMDNLNDLAESFVGDFDPVGVTQATTGSDLSVEGESSGGEGETAKAYEITKEIEVEDVDDNTFLFVMFLAILSVLGGYVKKRYYD